MQKSDPNFTKACKIYCDAMADGKGHKEALKLSKGLNHAQAGLAWYGDTRNPQHVTRNSAFDNMTEVRQATYVAELRTGRDAKGKALHNTKGHVGEPLSWGQIMVITGRNESQVRNLFGSATGIASEGTRSGQGGRHLDGKAELYVGNHKGIGVEAEQPRQVKVDQKYVAEASNVTSVLPARIARAKASSARKAKGKAAQPIKPTEEAHEAS